MSEVEKPVEKPQTPEPTAHRGDQRAADYAAHGEAAPWIPKSRLDEEAAKRRAAEDKIAKEYAPIAEKATKLEAELNAARQAHAFDLAAVRSGLVDDDDVARVPGEQHRELLPGALAVVDEIGVGASVVDRLREQQYAVEAFNASATAPGRDRTGELVFLNKRAWAFWFLRDALDPASDPSPTLALPPDETLLEDLCAPQWKKTSAGRIQLEEKEQIKKRLGRSPDVGEAVVMAVAGEQSESLVAFF